MGAAGVLGCEWVSDAELMDGSAELSCPSHSLHQDTAHSMVVIKEKECTEAKKHCWYFEGLYPTYYICRSYEDCCGSRCCVRALSIQRLWYFWFLLMMGVLFCCGAGFFIRRRMYPPPLVEEPTFNVSYTRQPVNTASGSQQPGVPYYTDPGGPVMNPMAMAFHVQPNSPQGNPVYPPPPSYCNTPPPPYEQVVKSST
uniref:WW domain binding protein VOPP1 n=1 Tax=Gallus gallus TaxID=9031 RepID=A0A8V0XZZ6_CHICK